MCSVSDSSADRMSPCVRSWSTRPPRPFSNIPPRGIVQACSGSGAREADMDEHSSATHHGYITDKDAYLARLKRIEGQARGLQKMVEDEKYCIDILTQVSAMTKALQSVALGLLDDHMAHCVVDAAGGEREAKLREASEAIARLVRS